MAQFRLKISEITSKTFVVYLETAEDLPLLASFELWENILNDIQKNVSKAESSVKEYFLGHKKIETLICIISKETSYQKQVLFLGKHFPKFTDTIALFASSLEAKKLLLELCELSRYSFQLYKTEKKQKIHELFCTSGEKKLLQDIQELLENIILARDLGETPACDLTPEIFAKKVKATKFKHIKVKVLSYKDIQKQGLWLIEGVGKGSINKPCMILLEHIRSKKQDVHGIVGKGVTFDTGGNQIKPGDAMYDMKGDMGWAAVTYGLMKELDRHNVDKNIVACLVLAENVVSSNSYKPSDILRGYTGKTVEVIHTDAEGRLVLADGISYLGKK